MNEINTLEISERTKSFSSTNSYITLPKQTYRILSHWIIYVLAITFIVIAFTFLGFGIKDIVEGDDIEIHNFIIFVVLIIISCLITYFFPFYTSITIDILNRIVVVKKYKLFFIIKKETRIDTDEIVRAYTEINYINEDNKTDEDGFNLVFELKHGEKIIALEGEPNRDFEMIKIGYFMKKFFPGLSETNNSNNNNNEVQKKEDILFKE